MKKETQRKVARSEPILKLLAVFGHGYTSGLELHGKSIVDQQIDSKATDRILLIERRYGHLALHAQAPPPKLDVQCSGVH